MYYLVLGDFGNVNLLRSYENFNESESRWILIENILSVIYFFLATFITQITIFNMLIAIMSVTHDKHNDMIDENSKKQRLMLQAEFNFQDEFFSTRSKNLIFCPLVFLCNCCQRHKSKKDESYNYLVVTRPRDDAEDDDDDRVGGGTKDASSNPRAIRKVLEDRFREIDTFLNKKVLKGLVDMNTETGVRLEQLEHTTIAIQETIKKDT